MAYLIKHKSKIMSIAGALFLGGSVLLLESMIASGIFGTLGLILLFCGGRYSYSRSDIILNGVLLLVGHVLRFFGLFDGKLLYTLFFILLFIPYCAVMMAALFADRLLQKSGHTFLATLVLPVTYSLCAFLLTILNLGFLFNLMGYIMCIPVVSVNLSFLGEYILTFVLMWILICLSAICFEPNKKIKITLCAVPLVLSAVLLIGGAILHNQWNEPDYTLKVALATSGESDFTGDDGVLYTRQQQLDLFASAVKQAADDDAKLLVLCEEYFYWREENTDEMLEEISDIVRSYGIPALVGVYIESQENLAVNEALYFDADGEILYTYIKNNLVPFIEAGYCVDGEDEPAVIHTTIDGHTLDLAVVICYDVNDEVYLRKIPSDTELLIVPSWDWNNVNLEQRRTAVRSATLGLTMLKHSYDGFSHVSCPNGDLADSVDFRSQYETVKTVSVPIWEK